MKMTMASIAILLAAEHAAAAGSGTGSLRIAPVTQHLLPLVKSPQAMLNGNVQFPEANAVNAADMLLHLLVGDDKKAKDELLADQNKEDDKDEQDKKDENEAEEGMKADPEVAYAKKGVKKEAKAPAPAKAEKPKLQIAKPKKEVKAPAPAPDKKKAEDQKKIEDAKKFKKAAEDDITKKVKKAAEDEKKAGDQKKTEDEKKDKRDKRTKKRAENKKSEHKSSVATEFDDFLPGCLIHTAEVVQKIDHSYTDAQLKTVLKHECLLSQEFPTVSDAFFATHSACMDFAEFLDKARDEELTSGSTKGYTTFCKKFFEHVSGRDYSTETVGNKGSKSAASGLGLNWGLASLAVVLVARLM